MVGLYWYRDADVMEFGLGSKSASASVVDATASTREVASLQEKVKELTSKLAEFDVSVTCIYQNAHYASIYTCTHACNVLVIATMGNDPFVCITCGKTVHLLTVNAFSWYGWLFLFASVCQKSIVSASDTVTPSNAAAVKICSQVQQVGYSVNRSYGNGEPNNDSPRGPSV